MLLVQFQIIHVQNHCYRNWLQRVQTTGSNRKRITGTRCIVLKPGHLSGQAIDSDGRALLFTAVEQFKTVCGNTVLVAKIASSQAAQIWNWFDQFRKCQDDISRTLHICLIFLKTSSPVDLTSGKWTQILFQLKCSSGFLLSTAALKEPTESIDLPHPLIHL
jgi:hypothetical protein